MKKSLLLYMFILRSVVPAISQHYSYGVQIGSNYSIYSLSESSSTIQVTKGSIGFHSGLFFRNDFDSFYLGADLNYSSTLGGTIDDNSSTFKVRTGSVNLPLQIGKKFYPGIRVFFGGVPTIYIKTNHNEFRSYLKASPSTPPSINGDLFLNKFVFFLTAGAGYEFSKFFIDLRYEHPLDFFIREDYSSGGTVSGVDNYHYLSQIVITLGYHFN